MPRAPRRPPIAILTDFGYRDHYAGVMRGVIASIAPGATVIDITHGVAPQSIVGGAIALAASWRYFPAGTIFLAVVDPGVGTARAPIAIETRAGARFVGPDNGLLWPAADAAGIARIVKLESPKYRLKEVSATFHGRDIFAPAAAHLARGVALGALGKTLARCERLALAAPRESARALSGRVIYVDQFGNMITNIDRATLARFHARFRARSLLIRIEGGAAMKIVDAYGRAPRGTPLATFGSFGLLEIAVRDGSAARRFGARDGTRVTVAAR